MSMWDQRFGEEGFAYGAEPNDFLRSVVDGQSGVSLTPGRCLSLAEGEGRNAVFLAQRGHTVHAVDSSAVGLAKAEALARDRGVAITTQVVDLAGYEFQPAAWDLVVAIWCHLPPELRQRVHRSAAASLRPGGAFVLEGYTPDQLRHGTGGPKARELLMTLAELREELQGLDLVVGREVEREIHEGRYHDGQSAVVQVVAVKRAGAEG